MKTLTYTSFLGIFCLVAEVLNFRKYLLPILLIGLAAIFTLNSFDWNVSGTFYHDMLRTDNFSVAFSGLLIAITFVLAIMTHSFYEGEISKLGDYLAIIFFTLTGALAMVSFSNMTMLFIGIEVLSISLYLLAGSNKKNVRSNEAGMKYFLMGSFASGILLFGITLVYGVTGSFNLAEIAHYASAGNIDRLFIVGVTLILIALLFKISAAPFHFWAPDVYEGAPMLTTAMMATLAKIAAFAAFYRLFYTCFLTTIPVFSTVIMAVSALTMLVGNLSALNQDSFKRILAFSGIAHAGYMLLAILSIHNKTEGALFFYAIAYALATLGAFSIAIIISKSANSEKVEAYKGLGKSSPLLAGMLTLLMLSMAGIPPFAGFFGKYFLFYETVKSGHLSIVIFAVINSMIAIYYYFKVIFAMWSGEESPVTIKANPLYTYIAVLCVLGSLILGLFPGIIVDIF